MELEDMINEIKEWLIDMVNQSQGNLEKERIYNSINQLFNNLFTSVTIIEAPFEIKQTPLLGFALFLGSEKE